MRRLGGVKYIMVGLGTIVNVSAVIVGSMIGMLFNGGLKQRFQDILMQALGLSTMFLGIAGTLKGIFVIHGSALDTTGTMVMIVSLVLGGLIGEAVNIEEKIEYFGEWLKQKAKSSGDPKFVEGFVTATMVICIGAMAVVGSVQDGISGDATMLFTKAILDFIIVMVLASAYGKGVIFSALPLGVFQGLITVFAHFIQPVLTQQMIQNISYVGSILIFCVGINLSFGKKFKVGNLLPALIVAIACSFFKM